MKPRRTHLWRLFAMRVMWLCMVATLSAQTTTWGGEHVRMDVIKGGATLDFDCAHGTIIGPIPERGTFRLRGTFTPERGGPVREGDPSRAIETIYVGAIDGDTLALTILRAGSEKDQEIVAYVLVRGSTGNVMKCRWI